MVWYGMVWYGMVWKDEIQIERYCYTMCDSEVCVVEKGECWLWGFGAFKLMKGQLHVRTSQHPNCQGVTCEGSADMTYRDIVRTLTPNKRLFVFAYSRFQTMNSSPYTSVLLKRSMDKYDTYHFLLLSLHWSEKKWRPRKKQQMCPDGVFCSAGAEVGAHILSGNVFEPRALQDG